MESPWLDLHQLFEAVEQRVNVGVMAIGRQACAGRAFDAESMDKRLGTMMATSQCYAVGIEIAADILCREAHDGERHDTPSIMVSRVRRTRTPEIEPSPSQQAARQANS